MSERPSSALVCSDVGPTWLTISQVAELLQVSERTVIRATKATRDRLLAARDLAGEAAA